MGESFKEQRIRKITNLYYSRPEIQQAIWEFCKNREISPRYFEGFGKRPDVFQYPSDISELAKKGATSFHCSEEIWTDPLQISTNMNSEQYNEIREGWDLVIDIDCKWFDYSKLAAIAIIKVFKENGINNFGIKFSGSKGWHLIIPWKSFPKTIGDKYTKDLFPELPRKLIGYIRFMAEKELKKILPDDFENQFKGIKIKRGKKCNKCGEIANEYELTDFFCPKCNMGEQRKLEKHNNTEFRCPNCQKPFKNRDSILFYECGKCGLNSKKDPNNFSGAVEEDLFDLMGLDLILVSPRHLFRAPFSLHEKTALASVVLDPEEVENFNLKDADPMGIKIKNFTPEVNEGEAERLLIQALDWDKENNNSIKENVDGKYANFKPIQLKEVTEAQFPPCIHKILEGVGDGRKRALFILINLFRSIGTDKVELEKKIEDWNKKNKVPLKQGYIISQLAWAYRRKPIMPQNCKEFYQNLGVCLPDNFCSLIKNPVNYIVKKNILDNKKNKKSE